MPPKRNKRTLPKPRGVADGTVLRRKLRYATHDDFDTTPFATYSFRGNGCFDPDITSAGAQPYGFDQYMALYKNFRVLGSSIRVHFLCETNTVANAQMICVIRADSASGATLSTWEPAVCARNSTHGCTNGFNVPPLVLSMHRSTASMLDVSPNAPTMFGTASADPTVQWHWHVHVATVDASSANAMQVAMFVEYDVEFSGLKTLEMS